MRKTKDCTRVFFGMPDLDEVVQFEQREYKAIKDFGHKPFRTTDRVTDDQAEEMLKEKMRELAQLKELARRVQPQQPERAKSSWKDKVDHKRLMVKLFLENSPNAPTTEICKFVGCSAELVKRVKASMDFSGQVELWTAPNAKDREEVDQLNKSISSLEGTYSTVTELKRLHPGFSRKWILRRLHETGFRYHMMAKKRRSEKTPRYSSKQVTSVVRHLAQCMMNPKVHCYYIDEVHFPLNQTALKHWTKGQEDNQLVYNRRPVKEQKISAIALCDLGGFRAVQFFQKDVTGEDFLFFLQEFLQSLDQSHKVTILADNAAWHKAKNVEGTRASHYLHFNAPGLFQSNPIENCFSFVRAGFRKRRYVETKEEEVRLLLEVFFDPENPKKMAGIARNHVRVLRHLLQYHVMALASRRVPK